MGGGGGDTSDGNGNNDDGQQGAGAEGFQYPTMFESFEEFRMSGTSIPLNRSADVLILPLIVIVQGRTMAMVTTTIDDGAGVQRSHCEKGTAIGTGITYDKDNFSASGSIIYATSSGPMMELTQFPDECGEGNQFLDGDLTFDLQEADESDNSSLTATLGAGDSVWFYNDRNYFTDSVGYKGTIKQTFEGGTLEITTPFLEVFTVQNSVETPYAKGDYTKYEDVVFKNYSHKIITDGKATTKYKATWTENSHEFILEYQQVILSERTLNRHYILRVPNDESKTIEADISIAHLEDGHFISTWTYTKDGKTETKTLDSRKALEGLS